MKQTMVDPFDRRRILVIDDNPAIHSDFKKVLLKEEPDAELAELEASLFGDSPVIQEAPSYVMDHALQGEEGWQMVVAAKNGGRPYSLAFVDMRMPPGWDGLQTIEQIWKSDPDIEIVICTAYSDYSFEQIEDRLGVTDKLLILKKPFDTIEVSQLAMALTQKWDLSRQAQLKMDQLEALVSARTSDLETTLKELEVSKNTLERQNKILHELYEGTAGATGKDFFELATRHLGQAIGVDFAFIGEYQPRESVIQALAIYGKPGQIAPFSIDPQLWQAMNQAPFLVKVGNETGPLGLAFDAKSLLLVPLQSPSGQRLGIMAALHSGLMELDSPLEKVIPIFANRVAAEIERQQSERNLRDNERAMFKAQKLESLGILAGGIAHDFNNLLCGVTANASLLLRDLESDHPMRKMLEPILHAAKNASELSNQLLAYTGQGKVLLKPVDFSEILNQIQPLLSRQICPGTGLHLDIAKDGPAPVVRGDMTQLRQVIMNLVLNAHEAIQGANQRGAIVLKLLTKEMPEGCFNGWNCGEEMAGGHYVCLEVWDSGPGMPADVQPKIFEPFFTTKFTGRGLGLAAVLGIIRGHHGAITVQSTPGEGAVFRICLPISNETVEIGAHDRENTGVLILNGEPQKRPRAVLLVDDEPIVRDVAEKVFKMDDIKVFAAASGEKALELFKQNHEEIGCLVLDLTMPGLSGMDTLRAIRNLAPDIPAVMISGYSQDQVLDDFSEGPPSAFIQKPFDPDLLLDTVNNYLEKAGEPVGLS